jgi:LDH2 family malate/lactate/ureidoglycolate dehydrogenase
VDTVQKDRWTILTQGWTVDDKKNPTDNAYELMADVKKALGKIARVNQHDGDGAYPDIYLLGGLLVGMEYEAGTVRPPDEQSSKAFFWMRVILKFTENVNDPYDLT